MVATSDAEAIAPHVTRTERPQAIAHRAGNDLSLLHMAEDLGVDYVETDLWLHRGRVEVRHARTFGELPLPLLWDRWRLAPGWGRLSLARLLSVCGPTTMLMLDLKGTDVRLSSRVIDTMAALAPGRPYAVCSQSWQLLDPFRQAPQAFVIHSVGTEEMLREVPARLTWHSDHAISIDHRLLTAERVVDLLAVAPTLVAWTVNSAERVQELLNWGVTGITSDRIELLAPMLQARTVLDTPATAAPELTAEFPAVAS